jgi:putative tryptophan/tyrosine transport system substrate-binding protein
VCVFIIPDSSEGGWVIRSPENGVEESSLFHRLPQSSVIGLLIAVVLYFLGGQLCAKPRVAVVMSRSIPPYQKALEGFKKTFDCETSIYELQKKKGHEKVATEIKASNPDLVLTIGSSALRLAAEYITGVPVVFTMVLSAPKLPPNIAGVSMMLPAKVHLEGLKLVAPTIKTVGLVFNPKNSGKRVEEFRTAAKKLDLKIVAAAASSKKEAFSSIKLLGGRVDALWMVMDKDVVDNFNLMLSLSVKEQIPLATFSYRYVEMGALLALSPRFDDLGRQAGELANQIALGVPPAKIGIVSPKNYYYSYNSETGVKIKLGIPAALLQKDHRLYPE